MNPLCWTYIRTKTSEAMNAGIQDALGEAVKLVPGSPALVVPDRPEGEELIWSYIQSMARQATLAGMQDAVGSLGKRPDENTESFRSE